MTLSPVRHQSCTYFEPNRVVVPALIDEQGTSQRRRKQLSNPNDRQAWFWQLHQGISIGAAQAAAIIGCSLPIPDLEKIRLPLRAPDRTDRADAIAAAFG